MFKVRENKLQSLKVTEFSLKNLINVGYITAIW